LFSFQYCCSAQVTHNKTSRVVYLFYNVFPRFVVQKILEYGVWAESMIFVKSSGLPTDRVQPGNDTN
jgi:hypothetical protein